MTRREMLCGLLKSAVVAPLVLFGIKPAKSNAEAIRASAATLKTVRPLRTTIGTESCDECGKTFRVTQWGDRPFSRAYSPTDDDKLSDVVRHTYGCLGGLPG